MMIFGDDELKTVARSEAEASGVDLSSVAICKKIRNLAKLDRLTLRTDSHNSGYARNLLEYLDYVGLNAEDYVKDYLRNLQPYMIERDVSQEPNKAFRCVIDNMYAVSLYIKMDTTQFEEVVVSFHESYGKGGVAKRNLMRQNPNRLVPIFADNIGSVNRDTKDFSVHFHIQRGLLTLPLSAMAVKCEDFFLVRERDVSTPLVDYCNRYIEELYSSNLDLNFDEIEVFSVLQQLSFTSYGRDTFSSVSLLVDSLNIQGDVYSKKAADFALITFVQNLKLTTEQKDELVELLHAKYAVSNVKQMSTILLRIEDALEKNREETIVKEKSQTEQEPEDYSDQESDVL